MLNDYSPKELSHNLHSDFIPGIFYAFLGVSYIHISYEHTLCVRIKIKNKQNTFSYLVVELFNLNTTWNKSKNVIYVLLSEFALK